VLRSGRSRSGDRLAVHVFERPGTDAVDGTDPDVTRLTVVASKRVGNAVRRNRAKRLMREAARACAWRDGLDVVLVARAACAEADAAGVTDELVRLAGRLGASEGDA